MAKVDVVVPCYNYGRFLEACVGSVLRQSIDDVRILIIDDASSDESVSVAMKLAGDDPRVSVISHTRNQGHIETYNEGIAWTAADYFLLLSADDLLVDGALQRATEVMDQNSDIVLTFGDCITWLDNGPLPPSSSSEDYSWRRYDLITEMCTTAANVVPTPTAIARTSVQKKIGGYRKSLPHAGDMEMWLRFAANGAVARIDAVQAVYRKHSTAMSNAYSADRVSDYHQCQLAFESFFDEYDDRLDVSRRLRRVARRALAERVFRRGTALVRWGHPKEGARLMYEASKIDRRLRYFPPLWHLFKPPGVKGLRWAWSILSERFGTTGAGMSGVSVGPNQPKSGNHGG